jgi:hypothetical protein
MKAMQSILSLLRIDTNIDAGYNHEDTSLMLACLVSRGDFFPILS